VLYLLVLGEESVGPDCVSNLVKGAGNVGEVGKKVRIHVKLVFSVENLDFNRLAEVHGG